MMANIKKRFYVINHSCGDFSVQDKKHGAGELLDNVDNYNEEGASVACKAANAALKSVGLLTEE
jgi:hypothetical protein